MTDNASAKSLPVTGTTGMHYHGHRQRLKNRFRKSGGNSLEDYELLELLLFRTIPRRDTKPLAKNLIEKFGSFAGVINAPDQLLMEVSGVGEAIITEFRLINAATQRVLKHSIHKKPILNNWEELLDYCRSIMAHKTKEQFRIIFLDKRNRVIDEELQQEGTVDHTPVYIREISKRALELSATALILVHNHPSGDPTPSRADIEMTKKIIATTDGLGIIVHDHIIIGKDGYASLKSLGLI